MLGKRVNFKHFLVRLQDGKTCGNSCLVLVDNVLWYNPMRIFLRPCWSHCLPGPIEPLEAPDVLTEPLWGLAELGRAVHRLKLRKCGDDVGLTAEVFENMLQQNSGNICCQCTMISFIMAQCPDRGFVLYSTCCLKRCGQNKLLILGP